VIGQIERPKRRPPDPRTEFTVVDPVVCGGDADMISALNRALVARGKIKEIADIMVRTQAESADAFAHSMGTLLTMEGLLDLQQAGTLGRRGEINHIMLASPDINLDLFRTQLARLSPRIRKEDLPPRLRGRQGVPRVLNHRGGRSAGRRGEHDGA